MAISVLLAACTAPQPVAPTGPPLVIEVLNASELELDVAYEFTGDVMAGSGATLVPPCTRQPFAVGQVGGGTPYSIQVEGKTVVEGTVPAAAPEGASVMVRVLVGPDGEVEAQPPALVRDPSVDGAAMPGCGSGD